jgi:hypothetical protein
MTVERLLQLHVATLAALGTLLLGMGQRNPVLPVLSFFAAATSVYFTDKLRWFVLSRGLGNLAALGALMLASFEFWTIAVDQQLLAIANLLVYLQIILLYQQKNATRYWEISVLSLLQVVVAAALNLGFEFGVLLAVYMLTAFSALALFFVYREGVQFCAPEDAPSAEPKKRSLRRQLLGDPVRITPLTSQSALADSVLGWRFLGNVGALSVMTLVFTIVLFFSVPRTSNAVWHGHGEGLAQTGFEEQVLLEERGTIYQSDQIVMRVTFHKEGSDKPIQISGEPYFFGTALANYSNDSGRGRWSLSKGSSDYNLREAPAGAEITLQETVLNSGTDATVFSTPAFYAPPAGFENGKVFFDWLSGQVKRPTLHQEVRPTFSYTLASTGFRGTWQMPVTQHLMPADRLNHTDRFGRFDERAQLEEEKINLLKMGDNPQKQFPTLIATAEKVLAGANLKPSERVVAARMLQDHFRTPNAYKYTLDFSKIPRTKGLDPIEDFVANHRMGHCEYFASALCLMLRSQGIPARLVVGYKGGEYNSLGGYYWVRKLHAHSWVEVYLEKDQVPRGAIPAGLVSETGAWLRLDPTPASEGPVEVTSGMNLLAHIGDAMDYLQLLWDDYILGLNSERQKKSIFNPLTEQAANTLSSLVQSDAWQSRWGKIGELFGFADDHRYGQWFSWRAGLGASVAAAALILLYQLCAFAVRAALAWWKRDRQTPPARRVIEFYARLEELLGSLGIRRSAEQTQREFAEAASSRLAALGASDGAIANLPREITDAFYRVRFGEAALDAGQSAGIQQALDRLAALVTELSRRVHER